jgi:hypothetical protein
VVIRKCLVAERVGRAQNSRVFRDTPTGLDFHRQRPSTRWKVGRKNSRVFGTHLQGSISTGKGLPPGGRPLPVVNSSTSRFLQREIIFLQGYSNFLCGGPKVPLPAGQSASPPVHIRRRLVAADSKVRVRPAQVLPVMSWPTGTGTAGPPLQVPKFGPAPRV